MGSGTSYATGAKRLTAAAVAFNVSCFRLHASLISQLHAAQQAL
jgi:hypothetical protein